MTDPIEWQNQIPSYNPQKLKTRTMREGRERKSTGESCHGMEKVGGGFGWGDGIRS
jgi:hypothetical protein